MAAPVLWILAHAGSMVHRAAREILGRPMATDKVTRRLAAIVAIDVVGYSRLMEADEEGTLAQLKARRAVTDHFGQKYGGRIVNTAGDGLLFEFPSVVESVSCAVEVQRMMAERNAGVEDDRKMLYRIGINLSDVMVDGGDIFGDGVNVAARIQELAEPGGVCISDDVHRQVEGKLDVGFVNSGEHQVKNIARKIRVWRWHEETLPALAPEPIPPEPKPPEPLRLPDKPSIAVLAFDNLSGDPEQEYFADGIAEDIITVLSKFRWFFVISRNSSFTYKGKSVSVQQVAQELGVRYVLEGSVRKAGSRVRISAQLINALTGNHVWAERYDRRLADIFDLQDEMTQMIVGAIEPELGDAERARAKRKPPDSLYAWDQYQRGLWHYWQLTGDDAEEAERLLHAAISLDPGFSPAHAFLALVHLVYVLYGWTDAPEIAVDRALRSAQQAVLLDDKDPLAHYALGRVHTFQGDFERAIAELEKSLDLNPNHGRAHFGLGLALYWCGRAAESLPYFQRAIRLSPHDPLLWAFENMVGTTYFHRREYDKVVEWSRKASRHPSSSFWPHANLARALVGLDRLDEARAAIDDALRKQPDLTVTTVAAMLRGLHPDYKEPALDGLRKAGLPE